FNFRAINPSARSESNEQAKRIKNRVCSPTQAKYRSTGTSNSRKPLIRLGTLSIPESTPVRQSFSNPKPHKSRKRARMLASFVALVIKGYLIGLIYPNTKAWLGIGSSIYHLGLAEALNLFLTDATLLFIVTSLSLRSSIITVVTTRLIPFLNAASCIFLTRARISEAPPSTNVPIGLNSYFVPSFSSTLTASAIQSPILDVGVPIGITFTSASAIITPPFKILAYEKFSERWYYPIFSAGNKDATKNSLSHRAWDVNK